VFCTIQENGWEDHLLNNLPGIMFRAGDDELNSK